MGKVRVVKLWGPGWAVWHCREHWLERQGYLQTKSLADIQIIPFSL